MNKKTKLNEVYGVDEELTGGQKLYSLDDGYQTYITVASSLEEAEKKISMKGVDLESAHNKVAEHVSDILKIDKSADVEDA